MYIKDDPTDLTPLYKQLPYIHAVSVFHRNNVKGVFKFEDSLLTLQLDGKKISSYRSIKLKYPQLLAEAKFFTNQVVRDHGTNLNSDIGQWIAIQSEALYFGKKYQIIKEAKR